MPSARPAPRLRRFSPVVCLFVRLLVAGTLLAAPATSSAAEPPADRWIYLQTNLQVADNLQRLEPMLDRASKAGYNGVVLADYKLNVLDRVPEHYFTNAARFRRMCAERGLEIIPAVCGFGYSSGILAHDPNLAEALPVQAARLIVRNGEAAPELADRNLVPGDFEKRQGDRFEGWSYQDEPGAGTWADTEVRHGGSTSLRIEQPAGRTGNLRMMQTIDVRPWTQYHAEVWIRSSGFTSAADVRMFAMSAGGRVLSHSNLGVRPDQDWTRLHVVFNSLEHAKLRFYVGVWDCGPGKLWIDDVRLVERPLINLVRRDACPLRITDESGRTVYEEGRDFAPVRDERLGTTPWPGEFEVFHEPPKIAIPPGSRLRDGQRLRIDFYHAVTIYDQQVACSLTDPKVFAIVEDQVRRTAELFEPKTWFMSHDEIRMANWSEPDRRSGRSAGRQLADNVRRCAEIIRRQSPGARLCVWSDMFDPHHNAVKDYYLVNGDLAGSWEGLDPDVTIVNWNSGKPDRSLPFFAERGHSQVLAGYYDRAPEQIRGWMEKARKGPGLRGVMYTTWRGNFADLEKFAKAAWGE